jgi:glycosyltransferase involved in cell wall biosynthesis
MQPVTLLLPIRNGELFVDGIIETMVANSLSTDEILIINDGSTDETLKLVEFWASREPRIKLISTEGIGLVQSLNLGFSESKYNWIARFDADDRYEIDRLQKQRELIGENISVIFADYSIFLNGKKFAGTIPSPVNHYATLLSLLNSQQTAHPVSLINKEKFNLSGGYLESEFPAEDLGLWARMSRHGQLISCPEKLFSYSLSKTSVSAVRRKEALQKKKEIVQTLLPDLKDIFDSRSTALTIFNSYSGLPLEAERKILFIRNLRSFKNTTGIKTDAEGKKLPNFYWYLIFHPFKILTFLLFQIMRKKFRKAA